ncbi:MAG: hypothetical protein NXI22_07120 [bacterium]|nr:hypothetical protein [bacterium]
MEFSLHRELKERYAGGAGQTEQSVGKYRIDAIVAGRLIEVQMGSLSAIRKKIAALLEDHRVLVIKPIIARKTIVKQKAKGGEVFSRRKSPKKGVALDIFAELMYFREIFPNPNLTIESPLIEIEEWRYPGRNKRRRRRRKNDFRIEDRKLVAQTEPSILQLRTIRDLHQMLPADLPREFDTADLAGGLEIHRSDAQCIAYCLRHTGAAKIVRKQGNAHIYRLVNRRARNAA